VKELEPFRSNYIFRDLDTYFALGRRSHLRYALISKSLSYTRLNARGPEPIQYLEYAKADLADGSRKGAINALSHAKRAIHLMIDKFMNAFELNKLYKRSSFPKKLVLFRQLDVFPTLMIENLNSSRNLMEHKYVDVPHNEVVKLTEIAEMFLLMTYPYFKGIVKGVYVGIERDDRCFEWILDTGTVSVYNVEAPTFVTSSLGRVHYNITSKHKSTIIEKVVITKANLENWLPYLDLFVYCTKMAVIKLPTPEERGHGPYMHEHTHYY